MWAHLHHESAVAGPLLQLLQRTATGDGTVRSEALECIAALVGAPWEVLLLLEFSWTHPLLGACYKHFVLQALCVTTLSLTAERLKVELATWALKV